MNYEHNRLRSRSIISLSGTAFEEKKLIIFIITFTLPGIYRVYLNFLTYLTLSDELFCVGVASNIIMKNFKATLKNGEIFV